MTLARERQFWKARLPIEVTLVGIVMFAREVQPEKALSLIDVTFFPMETSCNILQYTLLVFPVDPITQYEDEFVPRDNVHPSVGMSKMI